MKNLYLGLVHHPIKNKRGAEVTTSVTNLDIHDIARSCRTFGFNHYFIVTPIKKQQELIATILNHWEEDKAGEYNPDRQDALSFIQCTNSIEESINKIEELEGHRPLVAVTGANFQADDGDEKKLRERMLLDNKSLFLLFGTGWGLMDSVVEGADFRLTPLRGIAKDGYNHLSVRSAVAIYCDRIGRVFKETL